MYSLEYGMLVQVLRQLRYSGEFYADVSPRASLRTGGHVRLFVQNGTVVSCVISDKQERKLYHDADAYRLLPALGILDWKLAPSPAAPVANPVTPPPVVQERPVERVVSSYPRRYIIPEALMRTWSPAERSVYFLADGAHSIDQIARLLSRPPDAIEQILHHLEIAGAIIPS